MLLMSALKTIDFGVKICYDMIIHPGETASSIRLLVKTHNSIFSISDTYLGYRKIKERPDLVHVQFSHLNHLGQAEFISEKFKCPFTITFRALDLYEKASQKLIMTKSQKVDKASRIITISEYNSKVIRKRFGRDPEVIHSAIDPEKFKPGDEKRKSEPGMRIIYVGRFVEKKGIEYLFQACQIMKRKGKDFEIVLIGDGPLLKTYHRLSRKLDMEDKVLFKKVMPQEEIIEELKRSDIFVLPSVITKSGDRDILPNSLKEAMAMEIPVITTNISGIEELVEDDVSGLLVSPEDPMAIARALERLMTDPGLRERMGKEGRIKVIKEFNVHVEAKKLIEVFRYVTGNPMKIEHRH